MIIRIYTKINNHNELNVYGRLPLQFNFKTIKYSKSKDYNCFTFYMDKSYKKEIGKLFLNDKKDITNMLFEMNKHNIEYEFKEYK